MLSESHAFFMRDDFLFTMFPGKAGYHLCDLCFHAAVIQAEDQVDPLIFRIHRLNNGLIASADGIRSVITDDYDNTFHSQR